MKDAKSTAKICICQKFAVPLHPNWKSMFAICYQIENCDPKQEKEISMLLQRFDFYKHQDGFYLTNCNDMTPLFSAIEELKTFSWFKASVRDIRAFRVENWSDFTQFMKE